MLKPICRHCAAGVQLFKWCRNLSAGTELQDFVKSISIFPDNRVVLGSKDILSGLNNLLCLKSDEPVLLSYDTTFNVGDFLFQFWYLGMFYLKMALRFRPHF